MGKEWRMRTVWRPLTTRPIRVGVRTGGGRAAAQWLRRRLPRTQATAEGLEELSFPVAASATPPVLPAAAKKKTKAGAIAFVRHYVAVLNYATFSGQTKVARAMDGGRSAVRASACSRRLTLCTRKVGRVEGGAWKPTPVSRHCPSEGFRLDGVDAKISPTDRRPSMQEQAQSRSSTPAGTTW